MWNTEQIWPGYPLHFCSWSWLCFLFSDGRKDPHHRCCWLGGRRKVREYGGLGAVDIFILAVYTLGQSRQKLGMNVSYNSQTFRPALLLEYTSTFTMHSAHSPKTHAHAACMHIAQFLSFFCHTKTQTDELPKISIEKKNWMVPFQRSSRGIKGNYVEYIYI